MEKNSGIIPVTQSIRGYLEYQKKVLERIKDLYVIMNLSTKDYRIFEKNHNIVIEHNNDEFDMLREKEYMSRVNFFRDISKKIDKSLVWVYQELVLSGFGYDIPEESDIYQVSLIAYDDVCSFLKNSSCEDVSFFENSTILTGNTYEVILSNREAKKLSKKNESSCGKK